jgi:hypothetical protein
MTAQTTAQPQNNGILDQILTTGQQAAESFFDFRLAEERLEAANQSRNSQRQNGRVGQTPFPNQNAGTERPRTQRASSSSLIVPALIIGGVLLATRSK